MKVLIHELDFDSAQKLSEGLNNFWLMIHASIGPDERVDTKFGKVYPQEQFIFYITTPQFLLNSIKFHKVDHLRGVTIVQEYNEIHIKNIINKLVEKCAKDVDNWHEFAECLNKYSIWEYDDYKELSKK